MLLNIYVCDVVSTLKSKSKIVVSNNNLSIAEILEQQNWVPPEKGNVYPIRKRFKEVKMKIPVLRKRNCYS